MIAEILDDTKTRMGKSRESLKQDLSKVRTGRAHPSILNQVMVSYYGSNTALSQIANIAIEDSRTLTVTPWEAPMVAAIEKAIINSGLGLNPSSAGVVIRIPLPPLTEERRKDLVKVVRKEAEAARVAIRNIRRDANSELKEALKEKMISEDEDRKGHDDVQKLTDQFIKEIEKILEAKEADLMSV